MMDEAARRIEDLWTRYLARQSLTPEERAELAGALERDEVLRRRMILDLQLDGALRAAGETERGQEEVVAAVRALVIAAGRTEEVVAAVRSRLEAKAAARAAGEGRPAPTRRRGRISRGVVTTVLLVGSAAALVLLRPRIEPVPLGPAPVAQGEREEAKKAPPLHAANPTPRPSGSELAKGTAPVPAAPSAAIPAERAVARLETVAGTVYRQGVDGTRRAGPVLELGVGDWVWTSGPTARARLIGPAGSQIELEGDAVGGIAADPGVAGGTRFFVAHGRALGVVPALRGLPALVLASPHAIVSGIGRVRLDVGTTVTRVEVKEGRARVSALGVQRGTEVEAGQLALVSAEDLHSPRVEAGPREALLLTGPDDTKEPAPEEGLRGSEERLKSHLERIGFKVSVADAGGLTPERARTAALLVLSSSVSSNSLEPWFADLPVPMLVLESTGFEQLGLTGARWFRDVGPVAPLTEIVIDDPSHPLAAGLSGTVRVLATPLNVRWGAPAAGGKRIATYAGAPEKRALLFAFDRGARTAWASAPARRVGLFLGNGRVIRALTEQGWRLFEAAALWAVGN
jgi:hypothetical protein